MRNVAGCRALVLRALVMWLGLMGLETIHGVLRTLLLAPRVGEFRARQLSVLTGSLLILAITALAGSWLRATSTRAQLFVGGLWLALTLLFEVGLGRYGLGYSWNRLAADYNVRRGGLLPFGLAVLMLAPWATGRLRRQPRTNLMWLYGVACGLVPRLFGA